MLVGWGPALVAIFLFALLFLPVGTLVGYGWNVASFRTQPWASRLSLALLLGMAIPPIFNYGIGRYAGMTALLVFWVAIWGAAATLALWRWRRLASGAWRFCREGHWAFLGISAGWILLVLLISLDIARPDDLQRSLSAMDQASHVPMTETISRTGIPPQNPFAYPGHPLPMFYYFFWYLTCSLVDQFGGDFVTPRAAVQGSVVLAGFALAALYTAYRHVLAPRMAGYGVKAFPVAGWLLFGVTGLDILPWALLSGLKRFGVGPGAGQSIEWWNEQIGAWLGVVFVSPHHIMGTVLCFTGLLAVLGAGAGTGARILIGGAIFASAAGTSVYATLGFSAGLFVWVLYSLARNENRRLAGELCGAGMVSMTLACPFLLGLLEARVGKEVQAIGFTIRAFQPVDYWLPSLIRKLKTMPEMRLGLRGLFLPVNYLMEMGFFGIASIAYWRWRRQRRENLGAEERILLFIASGSVLICTFLESKIYWNDLGWRAFLPGQFVMLLWAAALGDSWVRTAQPGSPFGVSGRRLALAFACLGFLGTAGEWVSYRWNRLPPEGMEAVAKEEAYQWIRSNTSRQAVVLINSSAYVEYAATLSLNRQLVSTSEVYTPHFHVGQLGKEILREVAAFYAQDQGAEARRNFVEKYGIGVVVVSAQDPVWADRSSWVWRTTPDFANAGARVFLNRQPRH